MFNWHSDGPCHTRLVRTKVFGPIACEETAKGSRPKEINPIKMQPPVTTFAFFCRRFFDNFCAVESVFFEDETEKNNLLQLKFWVIGYIKYEEGLFVP